MNRKTFLHWTCLGLGLAFLPSLAGADVPGIDKAGVAALDALVGKAMDGYNACDWKRFYATGWADQTKAMHTEPTFNALYRGVYLKQFGTLKSRVINPSKSSFSDQVGLLVYDAQFSTKKGTLAVNFFKENGQFKIQQLQVQP